MPLALQQVQSMNGWVTMRCSWADIIVPSPGRNPTGEVHDKPPRCNIVTDDESPPLPACSRQGKANALEKYAFHPLLGMAGILQTGGEIVPRAWEAATFTAPALEK
jgi:hypothetical protein